VAQINGDNLGYFFLKHFQHFCLNKPFQSMFVWYFRVQKCLMWMLLGNWFGNIFLKLGNFALIIRAQRYKTFYIHNLRIFVIGWSVCH